MMAVLMFLILTGLSFFWRCHCCCINANSGNYQNKGFGKKSKVCICFCGMNNLKCMHIFSKKIKIKLCQLHSYRITFMPVLCWTLSIV